MTTPDRFDQLAATYNFRIPTDRVTLFTDVVQSRIAGLPSPRRVLDIGCGHGIAQSTEAPKRLRTVSDELWGIEPDEKVAQPSHVTHYQHALMENAKLPENYFNLAYSCLVMEHVAEPAAFLKALHRTLAPGGEYIFMTMNARHYFVRIASALRATGLDEFVLRRVRKGEVEEYHYPVQYRFNHPTTIARLAKECGFEEPRFAFVEIDGPKPYFPGPLRPFLHLMNWKRTKVRNPGVLLELYAVLRKRA